MASNDYRFVTHWRVFGTVEEISEVLSRPEDYPRWWPAVYLSAREVAPGNGNGEGRTVALVTTGWLPYTLDWTLRVTESRAPLGFAFEATGDLVGRGRWELESAGSAGVDVTLHWEVRADKRLIAAVSPALRPVFAANHRWAMRRGEVSLVLELARRRAATPEDRARVPFPPGPSRTALPALAAGAAAVVLIGAAVRRISRAWRTSRS